MRRELAALALVLLVLTATVASAASLQVSGGTIQGFVYNVSVPHATPTATPAPGTVVADIDIKPESFQRKSQGSSIFAFVELPPGYLTRDILIDSIRLCLGSEVCNDGLPVAGPASIGDADNDGTRDLKVTFDRASLTALLEPIPGPTTVALTLCGMVADTTFSGSDRVQIVDPDVRGHPTPTETTPTEATGRPDLPVTSTATPVERPTLTPTSPAQTATATPAPEATAVSTAIPSETPDEPASEPSPTDPAEPPAPSPTSAQGPDRA